MHPNFANGLDLQLDDLASPPSAGASIWVGSLPGCYCASLMGQLKFPRFDGHDRTGLTEPDEEPCQRDFHGALRLWGYTSNGNLSLT